MNKVEVCLTKDLIHLHDLKGKIVVVIDIFRFTSCMTVGLSNDVNKIYPVETLEECWAYADKEGFILAGEKGGLKQAGFGIGNSPFDYMLPKVKGKNIAVTTTNGTIALARSKDADQILLASFLNIDATIKYLKNSGKDVVLHCAGWRGHPCIEDTLFAGAVLHFGNFDFAGEPPYLAHTLFLKYQNNLIDMMQHSRHLEKYKEESIRKELDFCLTMNKYDIVIAFNGEYLVKV